MEKVGIIYRDTPEAKALMQLIIETLQTHKIENIWTENEEYARNALKDFRDSDMIIALGGDGTLLSVARACAGTTAVILGINFGHVGFLAELEPEEALSELPHFLNGEYWLDERAMLQGVLKMDNFTEEYVALNDIIIVRGGEPRVIRFDVLIDGNYFSTITADGVIVATATGSTAYNLAAGGPILYPEVRGAVLTPVAAHLDIARPIVLAEHCEVAIILHETGGDAVFSADGQITRPLTYPSHVLVSNSNLVTRFLRRKQRNHFYFALRQKLSER